MPLCETTLSLFPNLLKKVWNDCSEFGRKNKIIWRRFWWFTSEMKPFLTSKRALCGRSSQLRGATTRLMWTQTLHSCQVLVWGSWTMDRPENTTRTSRQAEETLNPIRIKLALNEMELVAPGRATTRTQIKLKPSKRPGWLGARIFTSLGRIRA